MGLQILPDKNKITRVINIADTMIVTKISGKYANTPEAVSQDYVSTILRGSDYYIEK
jgi:hypothetical protein